jgi:ubiquinone/menaquinone biosynthesis C-methylase UbiE
VQVFLFLAGIHVPHPAIVLAMDATKVSANNQNGCTVRTQEGAMNNAAGANEGRAYLPAAGHDFFLPLYDAVAKLLGADRARQKLLDEARLRPGQKVLDIGSGTGTFAVLLKQRHPAVEVIGLDPDPKALARARGKAERARLSIRFDQGFADAVAYPAATFDVVFSSFMFHHLEADNREKTLQEVCRVLRPGGTFYLLDFEAPDSGSGHGLIRLFHASDHLRDNSENRILTLLGRAGFRHGTKIWTRPVLLGFGRAGYYRASTQSG